MSEIIVDGGNLYLINVENKIKLVLFDEHVEVENIDEEILIFEDTEKRDNSENNLNWFEYSYICLNDEIVYLDQIFDGINPIGEY